MIRLSASCDIRCTVLTTKMAFSLEFTKSRTLLVEWLRHTWMSVSREKSTSLSRRWWMYDHLNSGIRNGGRVGPGLNMGRVEPDLERCCLPPSAPAPAAALPAVTGKEMHKRVRYSFEGARVSALLTTYHNDCHPPFPLWTRRLQHLMHLLQSLPPHRRLCLRHRRPPRSARQATCCAHPPRS